ncbi:MAG TPA: GerMN domain-containing protein [Candidatus Baltobacteraceae bacterium]
MRTSRVLFWIALLIVVAGVSWHFAHPRSPVGDHITVYYTKDDGVTEVPWNVSMRPQQSGESNAEHLSNTVLYAATQAVAGPPSGVTAIRFPDGTHVRSASVNDSTATVDLSKEVANQTSGVSGESGAFKALVWTLTALPGIDQVAVRVQGQQLSTLPGGHLEIDEPLRRSDW